MQSVLKKLVPLADAHRKADEYISGTYWSGNGKGKGCAIGCTIHDAIKLKILPKDTSHDDHKAVAEATGLPEMLWLLADHIFEGLSDKLRPAWTPRFLRAATKCKKPESVPARIMARLAQRLAGEALRPDVKEAAANAAKLWKRRAAGDEPRKDEWDAASQQADAASQQAYAARLQFWSWCADVVCEGFARQ